MVGSKVGVVGEMRGVGLRLGAKKKKRKHGEALFQCRILGFTAFVCRTQGGRRGMAWNGAAASCAGEDTPQPIPTLQMLQLLQRAAHLALQLPQSGVQRAAAASLPAPPLQPLPPDGDAPPKRARTDGGGAANAAIPAAAVNHHSLFQLIQSIAKDGALPPPPPMPAPASLPAPEEQQSAAWSPADDENLQKIHKEVFMTRGKVRAKWNKVAERMARPVQEVQKRWSHLSDEQRPPPPKRAGPDDGLPPPKSARPDDGVPRAQPAKEVAPCSQHFERARAGRQTSTP